MNLVELLASLAKQDIRLWVDAGNLRFSAPEGAMTDAIKQQIIANKPRIIEFLQSSQQSASQPTITTTDRQQLLPLSYSQERFWFLYQLEPHSTAYNMAGALRIKGQLRTDVLNFALTEISRRHEILRTRYLDDNGLVRQQVQAVVPWRLAAQSVPADLLPPGNPHREDSIDKALLTLAQNEATRPFRLAEEFPIRGALYQISPGDYLLLVSLHHIASDGWSMGLLVAELAALYTAIASGRPSPLPELSLQYGDYAVWQREYLSGERLEQHKVFWQQQLAGVPILNLPTDKTRPAVIGSQGDSVLFKVSAPTTRALKQIASQQGATLFMVLMAAYKVMLARYTRQDDICVGSPVANRNQSALEPVIGCFINSLAIRTDLSGNPSFLELLQREKNAAQQAFAHQEIPFEQVVDALSLSRDMAHTPVFQTMFVLQNAPVDKTTTLPGLTITPIEQEKRNAMFDLKLSMNEVEDYLLCEFEYRTELYYRESIQGLCQQLSLLLDNIAAQPQARIGEFNFLTPADRDRVFRQWNANVTRHYADFPVHERFEAMAAEFPARTALVCAGQSLSYAELNERANRLARELVAQGVEVGQFVGLCMERSLDLMVGILGILKAGGAYVPLDPHFPSDRLAFILEDSQAPILVTHRAAASTLANFPGHTIVMEEAAPRLAAHSPDNLQRPVPKDSTIYVLYTSGTTGKPKGCLVTHANVARLMTATEGDFGFDENDVWTLFHSYAFDFTVWEMWGALLYGGKLVIVPYLVSRSPDEFYELLATEGVTVLNQTPSAFSQLIAVDSQQPTGRLPLRYVVFGGEALDFHALRTWAKRHGLDRPKLVNMYGITETTVHVTRYTLSARDLQQKGSIIGRPITDLHTYLLDQYLQPVPAGVPGEIVVAGPGVTRGYLQRDDLTAEKFIANPFLAELPEDQRQSHARLYRSGDLARLLPSGDLEFLGRIDQQVKIRGHRIELGEIEAQLAQQPGIREAVVVVKEPQPGNQQLVAYLLVYPDYSLDSGNLRESLRRDLPDYMVPASYLCLQEWPLTPTGKVDKKALPEPEAAVANTEYVPPRNATEATIAQVWAEVLGQEQVGVHDNFFDIGGHSLLATQVISRIRSQLQCELPLQEIFTQPTVAGLAALVTAAQANGQGPQTPIPRLHPEDHPEGLPLSWAQQRLWLLEQLFPGNSAYHMPAALRLCGTLNLKALNRAIHAIIQRHDSLRTVFVAATDGSARQRVHAASTFVLEHTDLSALPTREHAQHLQSLARDTVHTAFDLTHGPLLRAHLVTLGQEEHALIVCLHHIIADGWSVGVLVQEIAALYPGFCQDQAVGLTELPIQYADFAHWQRQWLAEGEGDRQLAYWRQQLADAPVLELATDYPRHEGLGNDSGEVLFALDPTLRQGLQQLASRQGATLFMVLETAFALLMSRYSGQDDLCIGTPIANRNRTELEPLIGFFVNTLVLRHDLSGEPSFSELLSRSKAATLAAYAHQDVPFEQVVEAVGVSRNLSHTPLFQVMFMLQNTPQQAVELPGLSISQLDLGNHPSKFDLSLSVTETGDSLHSTLRYRSALFRNDSMERLAGHFRTLLTALVANPEQAVSRLNLLTPPELAQLRQAASPRIRQPDTLLPVFQATVHRQGGTPAVVYQEQGLSFDGLDRLSNRFAQWLRLQNVQRGERVGIYLDRGPATLAAIWACWKTATAYLPLDPSYPAERLNYMITDSGCRCVFSSSELPALSSDALAVLLVDQDLGTLEDAFTADTLMPEDTAYVIYTSGTTGQPKGVLVPHRGLVNLALSLQEEIYGELADQPRRISVNASITFDSSVKQLIQLAYGHCLYPLPQAIRALPSALAEYLARHQIEIMDATPSQFAALLPNLPASYRPRRVLVGGEAIQPGLWQQLAELATENCLCFNVYGPTECTVDSTWTAIAGSEPHIGYAIPNMQTWVLDKHQQPVPQGVTGELYIGGIGVSDGYLNQPALTAEKFIANPFPASAEHCPRLYRTGDLVRLGHEGQLEYRGRSDNQVKLRGFRIELGDIEAALTREPGIDAAAAMVKRKGDKELLVAYIVCAELDKAALRKALLQHLPDYMVPSLFMMLERLPQTRNGKTDYRALPEPDFDALQAANHVPPRTDTERRLASIWQDVLHLDQVGVYDNFFELGGQSLLATQVLARIQADFQVEVELRGLFEEPTIANLAALVDNALTENNLLLTDADEIGDDDEEFVL